jgi:predicted restriction endonuclease
MNSIAAHLGVRLGPALLRSSNDVEAIIARISETDFNQRHRSNFKSVLKKYVEMVQANFNGLFDQFVAPAIDVDPAPPPPRRWSEVSRIVRDTAITRELKRTYDNQCQICGQKLQLTESEFYAEAHHLQPLGGEHNGPDIQENLICVCPNCHVLLDYGALPIERGTITVRRHQIGQQFIDYHNERCR